MIGFDYRLIGPGWAQASISDGASATSLRASYLNDALGLLLGATVALLDGAEHTRCSWTQEPGEFRWILDRHGTDVALRILAFRDAERPEPDWAGRLVFATTQPLDEFAAAVAGGAEEVLDAHGVEGYLELWGHPFPMGALTRLNRPAG